MEKTAFLLLTILLISISAEAQVWDEGHCDTSESFSFLLVDKQNCTLSVIDSKGDISKTYDVTCAVNSGNKTQRGDHKTPEGVFRINQILDSTHLTHDFCDGKGPIIGSYGPWFFRLDTPGFNDIGIHGTHLPETIGTRASEGCIRMRNEDILDLKNQIYLGMSVVILPDEIPYDFAICTDDINAPDVTTITRLITQCKKSYTVIKSTVNLHFVKMNNSDKIFLFPSDSTDLWEAIAFPFCIETPWYPEI